ncbi:MAG TPA: tetratricopeptide repeat protein [Herpetosiphonaceae bacterium]|nr:tetratricopeptide repeat protein [Herpetosiphonaceae bacterium]
MGEIDALNIESTDDVAALVAYGEAAASRNDKPAARAALRRALKLDPSSVPAMLALAQVAGTFSERRQLFEQVLAREPGNIAARGGLEALQSGVANPHPASERPPIDATPLTPPITEALFCYRHPAVETGLRCIQCSNPICARCAKATPVGFLCPDCRKARRSPLYNVAPLDAAKGAAVSVVAGAIGAFVSGRVGIFILFFFGALLGEMVMRVITWATNKRGPVMQAAAGAGLVAGALLPLLFLRLNWIGLLIFLVIGIGTIVARLR